MSQYFFFILICSQLQNYGTSGVSKSSYFFYVCYYFSYNTISSRSNFFKTFFAPCVYFARWFFEHSFFFAARLTVGCCKPIYFIIDVFHNLLLLMFDVLVKSFVLVQVKVTMLTYNNRNHICLIYHVSPNHEKQWTWFD